MEGKEGKKGGVGSGLSRREEEQRKGGTVGKACPCPGDWKYKTSVWAEMAWGREMTEDPVGGR